MTAYTPNLPALITALPGPRSEPGAGDPGSGPGASPRAPQTEFTRARQVLFLENLSVTSSVRSAASAAQVSHQTAYRARRSTAAFRTAWDAALVVARAAAADVLAARAIDGIEEKVFYHGEEIATRTRYSDRLLLAHLARLDKLAETPAAGASGDAHLRFAEDWDAALGRFEAGEDCTASAHPEPIGSEGDPQGPGCPRCSDALRQAQGERCAGGREKTSPGPCNTWSMSYASAAEARRVDETIDPDDDEASEEHLDRILATMEAERPDDAPVLTGDDDLDPLREIEGAQLSAFLAGVEHWWLVVPPTPFGGKGQWLYHGEGDVAARASDGRSAAAPAG